MKTKILFLFSFIPFAVACSQNVSTSSNANSSASHAITSERNQNVNGKPNQPSPFPESHDMAFWKKKLPPDVFQVMYMKGTEAPYQNAYFNNHRKGVYVSAATGDTLFTSETKFESGTGWPSFYAAKDAKKVLVMKDSSFGMDRDEVVEAKTGLHLGHVFDDGPAPTGKRYCMNSAALRFIPDKSSDRSSK